MRGVRYVLAAASANPRPLGGRFPRNPGIRIKRSLSLEVCRVAARASPHQARRPSLCLRFGAWTILLESVLLNPFPCDGNRSVTSLGGRAYTAEPMSVTTRDLCKP